jgi:hypothetical protein
VRGKDGGRGRDRGDGFGVLLAIDEPLSSVILSDGCGSIK